MVIAKIDLRSFVDKEYQYGMTMNGRLSVDGNEKAVCVLDSHCMALTYRSKVGGLWRYITQEIPIEWNTRHYGSKESSFICPCCERKTLVLYHKGISLACRKCSNLTSKSKQARYEFVSFN
jgi:hypothetical protein